MLAVLVVVVVVVWVVGSLTTLYTRFAGKTLSRSYHDEAKTVPVAFRSHRQDDFFFQIWIKFASLRAAPLFVPGSLCNRARVNIFQITKISPF